MLTPDSIFWVVRPRLLAIAHVALQNKHIIVKLKPSGLRYSFPSRRAGERVECTLPRSSPTHPQSSSWLLGPGSEEVADKPGLRASTIEKPPH